jgi:acyl-CoA synthetase (AMP-forming)/AMP-acid ligase II
MVVILIDPGMGRKNMIRCLAEAQPDGLAGVMLAQVIRAALGRRWKQCRRNFTVGRRWWPLGVSTARFAALDVATAMNTFPRNESAEAEAAIIFTTGSTGPPKGVLYRHRHFIEQTAQIRDYFKIQPGTVDVSGFPLFALFNTGMAASTIFPKMDATRPASIDPRNFLDAVNRFQANQSFGSPALWNTVSRYCERHGKRMTGLTRVLTAGAPVPEHILKRVRSSISEAGEVHTPYGATESLPVACIESREVIDETWNETRKGAGICVGRRWQELNWKVIAITDGPIASAETMTEMPRGEIGELIVSGPVVTDRYVTRVDANALHKIQDGEHFWHRMGDVGYLDEQDRFWFCGRKGHRVQTAAGTLFTIPCEAIINGHPSIYRSALVGTGAAGKQSAAFVAEPWPEYWTDEPEKQAVLISELRELAGGHELTHGVERFFLMKALPVDIRHNSKIFRERLSEWVARQQVSKTTR